MNAIRDFFRRIQAGMAAFMAGRYGMDKLNTALLWVSTAMVFLALLTPLPLVRLGLTFLSYGLMGWAIFRALSRQSYKRYQENRRFLMFFSHVKDRQHKYFQCPRCRQSVRVPKGKGKIAITCPRCSERFIKKT